MSEAVDNYLRGVLACDLNDGLERVVELRREHRGKRPAPGTATRRVREQVTTELEVLFAEFWSLDQAPLVLRLEGLDVQSLPDLRRRRQRLLMVARRRDSIRAALTHERIHPLFARMLQQLLIESAGSRGTRMSSCEGLMGDRATRRFMLKSARHLRRSAPDVYRLEQDWLDGLAQAPRRERTKEPSGAFGLGPKWFIVGPVVLAVLRQLYEAL